jgi:hypothetical protein
MNTQLLSIIIILSFYQSFSQKKDTLYFYNLPHQIFTNSTARTIDASLSERSRELVDENIHAVVPQNVVLIRIEDSTITDRKSVNRHLIRLINQFENEGRIGKKNLSDTVSLFLDNMGYKNIIVMMGVGQKNGAQALTKGERAVGAVANVVIKGPIPAIISGVAPSVIVERANTSLYCLVLNKEEKKIDYYKSRNKNGIAFNAKVIKSLLEIVVSPYF